MKYKGKFVYEITKEDVGKQTRKIECSECGHKRAIVFQNILGRVLALDVGKWIFDVGRLGDRVYQVESQEQLEKRLS